MKYRLNNIKFTDGKALKDSVIFYWLDSELVTCRWQHKVQPNLASDSENLVFTQGLWIENDRNKQDGAFLRDIQFQGMVEGMDQYPMRL
jgi:hypothetical protein